MFWDSETNLGWKWLAIVAFTIPVIDLSPRRDSWYGYDMTNCYQKYLKHN